MTIPYDTAPNGWGDIWQRYVEKGLSPGGFGSALLTNDLKLAVMRADNTNKSLIIQHVMWMWDCLPFDCWGDRDTYEKWIAKGGVQGFKGKANDN